MTEVDQSRLEAFSEEELRIAREQVLADIKAGVPLQGVTLFDFEQAGSDPNFINMLRDGINAVIDYNLRFTEEPSNYGYRIEGRTKDGKAVVFECNVLERGNITGLTDLMYDINYWGTIGNVPASYVTDVSARTLVRGIRPALEAVQQKLREMK